LLSAVRNGLSDPTKVDIAASESCSRSGTFALLLSLALFAVTPYWLDKPRDIALGSYVALRLNLAAAVQQLDDSVNLRLYRTSNPAAESMTIAQLLEVRVASSTKATSTDRSKAKPTDKSENLRTVTPGPSLMAPEPPQVLSIAADIPEMPQIAGFLEKLGDSELLTASRGSSPYYNYSIYRWVLKRNSLIARNMVGGNGIVVGWTESDESNRPNYVPAVDRKVSVNYLTLNDVRELSSFELPTIPNTTKFPPRGDKEIEIAPGSLPRDLYPATVCAAALLLLVTVYFGAFAREAVSTETFPAAGTVFSALSRARWTLAAFALSLWIPFFACLSVAVASRKKPLIAIAGLMGGAIFSVHLLLYRKSYFHSLNPLRPRSTEKPREKIPPSAL
jgi:hypothetical protein